MATAHRKPAAAFWPATSNTSSALVQIGTDRQAANAPSVGDAIPLTMSSREIADLTNKDHRNVTADIRKMLGELGEDVLSFQRIYRDTMNREQIEFQLDRELTDTLLTGYSAVLRRKVIVRWRELERAAATTKPALPQNFAEALRILASEVEAKAAITAERDHAVATKHLIGSRREASAMATASAAVRETKKLKAQLGEGAEYASIIAVNKAFGLKLDDRKAWRPLKKWAEEHGVKPLDANDPRWGKVKRWPAGAWLDCHGVDLADKFGADGEEA